MVSSTMESDKLDFEKVFPQFYSVQRNYSSNNESQLILTNLRLQNASEFLYSIIFLLLVTRYLVHTHLIFLCFPSVYWVRDKVWMGKIFVDSTYMIELQKLLDRYSTFDLNFVLLKNLFLVTLKQIMRCGTRNAEFCLRAGTCYAAVPRMVSKMILLAHRSSIRWISNHPIKSFLWFAILNCSLGVQCIIVC